MPHDETAGAAPLAHHFDTLEQQREAQTLGMWLFLATEILFFGGMFTAYAVYRTGYPQAFLASSKLLDVRLGGFNTAVLLTSSFTMALAVNAAQTGKKRALVGFLLLTILFAATFLGVKGFEYHHKFEESLIPGPGFRFEAAYQRPAQLFFCLYFIMTGFHALHIFIGMVILGVVAWRASRGRYSPASYTGVELTGLYWHFVDIIWVFLFPLLYLIR